MFTRLLIEFLKISLIEYIESIIARDLITMPTLIAIPANRKNLTTSQNTTDLIQKTALGNITKTIVGLYSNSIFSMIRN